MKAALVLLVLGCGGSGAMTGDDFPGDANGDGAGNPTHAGSITIQSYTAEQPPGHVVQGGGASAQFLTASRCTHQQMDVCAIDSCSGAAPPAASAGTIAVTGAASPISLVPMADGSYPQQMSTTPLFAGGETLTVTGAGAEVPAFTASVDAPTKPQITSPAKPATFLAVERGQGLDVAWSGGSGVVAVFLISGATTISCRFPAQGGSGTVPKTVLSSLTPGQGAFAMSAITDAQKVAGDWAIDVVGYYNAVWPDDSIVSGPTMVQ